MGLLEKAQERKQTIDPDISEEELKIEEDIVDEKIVDEQIKDIDNPEKYIEEKQNKNSLLFKKNNSSSKEKTFLDKKVNLNNFPDNDDTVLYFYYKKQKIIEEKKGFGYKNLSTRRIVYNYDINDFEYQVSEPVLNTYEKKVKKELSYLFKMLADVNISTMDKEEKKSYLENTLEQIIKDNDIKFYKKEKNKKSISLKELFNFKNNSGKEKSKDSKNVFDKKSNKEDTNTKPKHNKIFERKTKDKENPQDNNFSDELENTAINSKKTHKIQLIKLKERGKN